MGCSSAAPTAAIRALAWLAVGAWSHAAAAGAVTVTQLVGSVGYVGSVFGTVGDPGQNILGMSLGSDMVGMGVTVLFSDGSIRSASWVAAGGTTGRAEGAGFVLQVTGDTWNQPWNFRNTGAHAVTRLVIDAGLGQAVFDRALGPGAPNDTAGSSLGRNFELAGPSNDLDLAILATYRDMVAVAGSPGPQGDLYRVLDIAVQSPGGLAAGSTLSFVVDTDNATAALVPAVQTAVPAPPPLELLAAVLVAAGAIRIVRRS